MPRIVHCADLHAGKPVSRNLDEEKASRRRREIETSLQRIIHVVREEKADLLVISGDLFEHRYTRPSWVKEASHILASVPATRVFIAPGNHDPALPDSLYRSVSWPDNVTVFFSPQIEEILLPQLGVSVYGRGFNSFTDRVRALRDFAVPDRGLSSIMVVHGDVVLPGLSAESPYSPIMGDDIARSRLDYLALGHVHAPMHQVVGGTTVVYPGCPEPLDVGDEGQRGIYLTDISKDEFNGTRVKAQFVPLSVREVRSAKIDIGGLETHEQVRNGLLAVGDETCRRQNLWTVTLTGRVDPALSIDTQSLERELSEDFFSIRITPDYAPDYDLDVLMNPDNQSLEARFARHLLECRQESLAAKDERGARVAERAMHYGLDSLRQGKIILRGRRWN